MTTPLFSVAIIASGCKTKREARCYLCVQRKFRMFGFACAALLCLAAATPQDWINIRSLYRQALKSEGSLDDFSSKSKSLADVDPLAKAYYGTALALRARASIAPTTKLSLANQAQQQLNAAAALQPKNLEIRFLRYSFEYGTPSFLNMKKHMQVDKPLVLQFAKNPSPIKDIAIHFLNGCDDLTAAEKSALR